MLMFTLANTCLNTFNLPWFMDLTFQVPMQYCSLQHQILLPSLVIYTAGHCFCFGSVSSFLLELFLCSSPVAHWAPTDLESSSFSVISFCLFILFIWFSRQEYWSGLPFHSPVDHILLELSTMTHPSWVALHGMAHHFTGFHKPLCMTRQWAMKGTHWERLMLGKIEGERRRGWQRMKWLNGIMDSVDMNSRR